jgi:leucine dehydrogenase
MVFEKIGNDGFEQIIYCNDSETGLKGIIAIHSTVLGPGVGGCRMWNYANEEEALTDVLRLSKGMTYKAAISNLNWGGGKSVIMGDPKNGKSRALLEKFGEYVNRIGGHYVTAKDVGIGSADLKIIKTKTKHVLGIDGEAGSSGDPSPATAFGTYWGMRAAAKRAFGTDSLKGLKIAVQGLGSVAFNLVDHLKKDGAFVVGCDVDTAATERAVVKHGIEVVQPDAIYDVNCDIFSPNALGATINKNTLPRIKAKVIAGAANNQLATTADGEAVMKKGTIYAPDYAINAGGLINIYYEAETPGRYDRDRAYSHIRKIEQTISEILERAQSEKKPAQFIADKIVEERLAAGKARNGKLQIA